MYYIAKGDIVTVYREHCTHMGLGLKRIFIGREEKEKQKKDYPCALLFPADHGFKSCQKPYGPIYNTLTTVSICHSKDQQGNWR
jgi:hypothetical protein